MKDVNTKKSCVEEIEMENIPVECKEVERKYDLERIALIILAAFMVMYGVLSVASYVCNWITAILIITVGIGAFCAIGGLLIIFVMIFFWNS